MQRRNVVMLLVISVIAVGIIAMKSAPTKKATNAVASTEHIEGLLKGGRPGALVFTYKADCCEAENMIEGSRPGWLKTQGKATLSP